jgi:hypothetical protein
VHTEQCIEELEAALELYRSATVNELNVKRVVVARTATRVDGVSTDLTVTVETRGAWQHSSMQRLVVYRR